MVHEAAAVAGEAVVVQQLHLLGVLGGLQPSVEHLALLLRRGYPVVAAHQPGQGLVQGAHVAQQLRGQLEGDGRGAGQADLTLEVAVLGGAHVALEVQGVGHQQPRAVVLVGLPGAAVQQEHAVAGGWCRGRGLLDVLVRCGVGGGLQQRAQVASCCQEVAEVAASCGQPQVLGGGPGQGLVDLREVAVASGVGVHRGQHAHALGDRHFGQRREATRHATQHGHVVPGLHAAPGGCGQPVRQALADQQGVQAIHHLPPQHGQGGGVREEQARGVVAGAASAPGPELPGHRLALVVDHWLHGAGVQAGQDAPCVEGGHQQPPDAGASCRPPGGPGAAVEHRGEPGQVGAGDGVQGGLQAALAQEGQGLGVVVPGRGQGPRGGPEALHLVLGRAHEHGGLAGGGGRRGRGRAPALRLEPGPHPLLGVSVQLAQAVAFQAPGGQVDAVAGGPALVAAPARAVLAQPHSPTLAVAALFTTGWTGHATTEVGGYAQGSGHVEHGAAGFIDPAMHRPLQCGAMAPIRWRPGRWRREAHPGPAGEPCGFGGWQRRRSR